MSHQHRRIDHSEDLVDTVTMDYYYMGEEDGAKPYLVAQDRRTGMMMSTSLREKGVADLTATKLLAKFLDVLGYKEVVLKSDGERALIALKRAAARQSKGLVRAIHEESPKGDSKANGEAEQSVREIKWRVRAITMMLEKKLNVKLPEGHPLLTWVPRYAAEQSNRFKIGHDGRTPEERRTGKRWLKPMPLFGERIMDHGEASWQGSQGRSFQDEIWQVPGVPQSLRERLGHDGAGRHRGELIPFLA